MLTKRGQKKGPFGAPSQKQKVVSATKYFTELQFLRGTIALARLPDVIAVDPFQFRTMTPPRVSPGTGLNTLRSLGVEQATASSAATQENPFQRNFWGIKIDHPGWNATDCEQWNANVTKYSYVKTSAVICEIAMPDAPIVKSEPVKIIRPGMMTEAQRDQVQLTRFGNGNYDTNIWDEIRPSGAWYYIVIPPLKGASINLSNCVGQAEWQELCQQGYKPRVCKGNKYRIMCEPKGFDASGAIDTRRKLQKLQELPTGVIPPYNDDYMTGKATKWHTAQETDWAVQYQDDATLLSDTFTGAMSKVDSIYRQGFDVLAMGSAIVFQFVQYCPPTINNDKSTAMIQQIPIELTIHNKTTFSLLKVGNRDLGQVYTLPVIGGV